MFDTFALSDLHLISPNGQEIDLSDTPATIFVTQVSSSRSEWFIEVQTNRLLDLSVSSYQVNMSRDDGQVLSGTVLWPNSRDDLGLSGAITLEGAGELNGYDLTR